MKNIYLNGTIDCIAPTELNKFRALFCYKDFAPLELQRFCSSGAYKNYATIATKISPLRGYVVFYER